MTNANRQCGCTFSSDNGTGCLGNSIIRPFRNFFALNEHSIRARNGSNLIRLPRLKTEHVRRCFYNSTKKRQHYFDILKAFFVRHSSEYKTSDSDRKVNRNIYPDAVTRDRMRLIDPKSGQLEPIHHCCLFEEL